MTRRLQFAIVLLLGLLTMLAATHATSGSPQRQESPPPAPPAFGPTLFLISPTAAQQPLLAVQPVRLHAELWGRPARFIASGSQAELEALLSIGLESRLLDSQTAGKVYYFVDARAEQARQLSAQIGQILYADDQQLLVATAAEAELSLLERLPASGIQLAQLSPDRLIIATEPAVAVRQVTAPTSASPFIVSLLDQVSADAIEAKIRDLSGDRPVLIQGNPVTLNTRYTFATRIRDAERYLYQTYQQLGLEVRYFDWSYGSYSGRNVIAEIPGSVSPERVWFVGGHFDSISQIPYESAPGADDNGSGTAATLVIANILRNYRVRDTIRFVHFSGEEQGQWGSKAYARDLALRGTQVMGFIDVDMIGWDGDGDRVVEIHTGTGPKSNALGSAFMAANDLYAQELVIERKTDTASRFSDHSPFWDNNFAAFLLIENFFDDARPRDRNPWYHNSGDLVNRVDLNYVLRLTKVVLATLADLAGIVTGATPTATVSPTVTPTFTASPPPAAGCQELISNGGFEESGGWSYGPTPLQARVIGAPVHSGSHALRLGTIDPSANRPSHSSAYQTVTIPATAQSVTLRSWQRPSGGDPNDYRELLLLSPTFSLVRTLERSGAAGTDQWQERLFDLTAQRGSTLVVYFNVYNDGAGGITANLIDDISLLACGPGTTTTPTATATPTASPSATALSTATATNTATATPALDPYPAPGDTRTPTPTPTGTRPAPVLTAVAFLSLLRVDPTATSQPTATTTVTPTPTATPVESCRELVRNGGFEEDGAWGFGFTPAQGAYVDTPVYAGSRAVRLGIPAGTANLYSFSSVFQTVTIPFDTETVSLSFQSRAAGGDSGDYRELLLLNANYDVLQILERDSGPGLEQWQPLSFDLRAYRGSRLVLYFNVYNNGSGAAAVRYLDEVSLRACP